jgi:hypothetical protein
VAERVVFFRFEGGLHGENCLAFLRGFDGPAAVDIAVSRALYVVQDRDLGVAC